MATSKNTFVTPKSHPDPVERKAEQSRRLARGEYAIRVTRYDAEKRRALMSPTVDVDGVKMRPVVAGAVDKWVGMVPASVDVDGLAGLSWTSALPMDVMSGVIAAVVERSRIQTETRQADALASLVMHLDDARAGLERSRALPAGVNGGEVWGAIRRLSRTLKVSGVARKADSQDGIGRAGDTDTPQP